MDEAYVVTSRSQWVEEIGLMEVKDSTPFIRG